MSVAYDYASRVGGAHLFFAEKLFTERCTSSTVDPICRTCREYALKSTGALEGAPQAVLVVVDLGLARRAKKERKAQREAVPRSNTAV